MTKKEKEEERIEKLIRSLLKLPENLRCINCSSLGPQYVCTTFNTFVCTNCSGVHREFTHRVKSVSMAKFNSEEISALQGGGNERARQLYLKEWDPQRNSYPDSSNLQKLRNFIRHAYVDRRYSGERSNEKLPRLRLTDKEESSENRRVVLYSGGSRSPYYEDRHEWSERYGLGGRTDEKTFKYYYDERRSPRYCQENSRYGGFKRSPTRFEVVDDRFRDDRTRSSQQSDVYLVLHGESRFGNCSSDIKKNTAQFRFDAPVVRPLKDILGENLPRIQVGEHSRATDKTDADGSDHTQTPTSSSTMVVVEGNSVRQGIQNSESLVDLNADSKFSTAAAAPVAQENLLSSHDGNCTLHESSEKENIPPAPKSNTLEFLLMELSVPQVVPAGNMSEKPSDDNPPTASGGNAFMISGASEAGHSEQMLASPSSDAASANASGGSVSSVDPAAQMLTSTDSISASTTASGGNMPAGSAEQVLALSNCFGASTAVSKGTVHVGSVSAAAPGVQTSAASVTSEPTGDSVPAVPVEETLTLLDASTTPSLQEPPSNGAPPQAALGNSDDSTLKVPDRQQMSIMPQRQTSALPADCSSTGQQTTITPNGAVNDQLSTSSKFPNAQGPSDLLGEYPPLEVSKPALDTNSDTKSQPLPSETKSSGRKELPADLFTATYSPAPHPIPGWQNSPPYGMGLSLHYYPNAGDSPSYPNIAKSTNPFDRNGETSSAQAPPFPSMGNLHGALPTHTLSTGSNASALMAAWSASYGAAVPHHSPSVAPAMPYGAYLGQQVCMELPHSRPLGAGDFSSKIDPFESLNMTLQPTSGYPNSLPSMGGNPFG